jgi:hypothetical protein
MRDRPHVREHGEHGIGEILAPDRVPPQGDCAMMGSLA